MWHLGIFYGRHERRVSISVTVYILVHKASGLCKGSSSLSPSRGKRKRAQREAHEKNRKNEVKQATRCEPKQQKNDFCRQLNVSMPTRGSVDNRLRDSLSEYSKHTSYMFWRLGVICNHFFVWCYINNDWPQLDPPHEDDGRKTKPSKNHNQTFFRSMIKIGTPEPAQQRDWE